ncbi:MAG: histidine phosphatase family protein, partial [Chloroflexota bacterium]
MTRLLLVRHGQTDWNLEGRWQGASEVPLNAAGWRQAKEIADELAVQRVDAVYSSPLSRSYDTARLIAQRQGLGAAVDPRLKEINLGRWEGMLSGRIAEEYPELYRQWSEDPRPIRPPEGETIREVHDRAIALVEELVNSHPEGNICLVTHKTTIVVIRCHYLGLSLPEEMGIMP